MRNDFYVPVRMSRDLVALIDRQAARMNRTRSAALRSLLEAALAAEPTPSQTSSAKGSPLA